jgi:DNA-binding NtrC family response regulator
VSDQADGDPEVRVKKLVLVVEDDEDVRDTLEMVLEIAGYAVLTAAEGSAALEILRANPDEIGVVLPDILLPKMDGCLVLEERSKTAALEDVPTIILSGAHPSNPISSHATAFLTKPIGAEDLLRTVRRYC